MMQNVMLFDMAAHNNVRLFLTNFQSSDSWVLCGPIPPNFNPELNPLETQESYLKHNKIHYIHSLMLMGYHLKTGGLKWD